MFKKIVTDGKLSGITFRKVFIGDRNQIVLDDIEGSPILCHCKEGMCKATCAAFTVRGSDTNTFAICNYVGKEVIIGTIEVETYDEAE